MEKTPARYIWEFFAEYHDDSITMPGGVPVFVTARTVRVLSSMFGRPLLRQIIQAWQQEGSVRVLGDWESLDGDAACIEVLDYVSEKTDLPVA